MRPSISFVIPTIESRKKYLTTAVSSVLRQDLPAETIIVEQDLDHAGAAAARDKGLRKVTTEFVAFLDDDDWLMTHHLEVLYEAMISEKADYTFSWFEVINGVDPFPENFGRAFDPQNPHPTTVTTLVKTELAQAVGMTTIDVDARDASGEDWMFTLGCIAQGAKIVHVPKKTWFWNHHEGNTSGLPGRGDAKK